MNTRSSLPDSLAKRLQNSTKDKPVHWSALVKEFVESTKHTEAELVEAMNTLLLPFGNISGNSRGFWLGLPE